MVGHALLGKPVLLSESWTLYHQGTLLTRRETLPNLEPSLSGSASGLLRMWTSAVNRFDGTTRSESVCASGRLAPARTMTGSAWNAPTGTVDLQNALVVLRRARTSDSFRRSRLQASGTVLAPRPDTMHHESGLTLRAFTAPLSPPPRRPNRG